MWRSNGALCDITTGLFPGVNCAEEVMLKLCFSFWLEITLAGKVNQKVIITVLIDMFSVKYMIMICLSG